MIDIDSVCQIAREAGALIMEVYRSDFDFQSKGDGSPLTLADQRAHHYIEAQLKLLSPTIPVMSEESVDEIGDERLAWSRYWLVDPLDGTKEFIKRNGEFTVNIALIDNGRPILGVVYAPDLGTLYFAGQNQGAFKQVASAQATKINSKSLDMEEVSVVASRSHASEAVQDFVAEIGSQAKVVKRLSMGSSLKLCLVAEGAADFYPRLAPTSEWDTAAAQRIVEAAGGRVLDCASKPLRYSKADILNPWFIVIGDARVSCSCAGTLIAS